MTRRGKAEDVLAAIDSAVEGYGEHVGTDRNVSGDAMRWAPDPSVLPKENDEDELAMALVRALLDTSGTVVLDVHYHHQPPPIELADLVAAHALAHPPKLWPPLAWPVLPTPAWLCEGPNPGYTSPPIALRPSLLPEGAPPASERLLIEVGHHLFGPSWPWTHDWVHCESCQQLRRYLRATLQGGSTPWTR